MVPQGGIEPPAYSLPMNYSTPELLRLNINTHNIEWTVTLNLVYTN